jgi:hypothetical protein
MQFLASNLVPRSYSETFLEHPVDWNIQIQHIAVKLVLLMACKEFVLGAGVPIEFKGGAIMRPPHPGVMGQ